MARAPTASGAAQDLLQPGPPPPTRQHPARPSPPQPSEASGQPRSRPRFPPPPARCRGTYQTERADLGGQSGGGADLPAGAAQVHCGHSAARQPRCNGPGRSPRPHGPGRASPRPAPTATLAARSRPPHPRSRRPHSPAQAAPHPAPAAIPARTDFDLVGVELGRHGGGAGRGWRRMQRPPRPARRRAERETEVRERLI